MPGCGKLAPGPLPATFPQPSEIRCADFHSSHRLDDEKVEMPMGGEPVFRRPDGRTLVEAPPLSQVLEDPLAVLASRLAARGIAVEGPYGLPTWDGGACDYGWAVDSYRSLATRNHPLAVLDAAAAARDPA